MKKSSILHVAINSTGPSKPHSNASPKWTAIQQNAKMIGTKEKTALGAGPAPALDPGTPADERTLHATTNVHVPQTLGDEEAGLQHQKTEMDDVNQQM
jgi:hypothetical protein